MITEKEVVLKMRNELVDRSCDISNSSSESKDTESIDFLHGKLAAYEHTKILLDKTLRNFDLIDESRRKKRKELLKAIDEQIRHHKKEKAKKPVINSLLYIRDLVGGKK